MRRNQYCPAKRTCWLLKVAVNSVWGVNEGRQSVVAWVGNVSGDAGKTRGDRRRVASHHAKATSAYGKGAIQQADLQECASEQIRIGDLKRNARQAQSRGVNGEQERKEARQALGAVTFFASFPLWDSVLPRQFETSVVNYRGSYSG